MKFLGVFGPGLGVVAEGGGKEGKRRGMVRV